MKKKIEKIGLMAICILLFASGVWAINVIQTQMSTDGNFEVSLIRAQVKGDVLTVQVLFKNMSSRNREYAFDVKDVYYTDTKEKKKYCPLKDAEGKYIAGPLWTWTMGGGFSARIDSNGQSIFWVKFPAPPETTETIDIYIPWALPFEDVKITR